MDWSVRSPGSNPIERAWDMLQRRVSQRVCRPATHEELENMLIEEWKRIPQANIWNLICRLLSEYGSSKWTYLLLTSMWNTTGFIKRINPYHAEFLKWNNPSTILALSIIIFRDITMKTWRWSVNSIEPGQTARMCRLAWLYIGDKG